MKLQRVLVPVDFSSGSLAAVYHAKQIAERANCQLHLLHVTDAPTPREEDLEDPDLPRLDLRLNAYHRLAAVIAGNRLNPFQTTGIVRAGSPEDVITNYAAEIRADLIVMGSHGKELTPPHCPGRVIEGVLGKARCPVLGVPERATYIGAIPLAPVDVEAAFVA